ncbi:MAG TPA: hypothetical protein VG795_12830 [Acidimicrobiia bacterium]|nr:hypothetical protein [Acidimicrobiia bacterium]
MVARKTKRVAAVTALSASMIIAGAAAFAHEEPPNPCPRGNGKGLGHGHPGKGKGKGLENGWPNKCKNHGNDDGVTPGGNTGGGTPGGGSGGSTGGDNTGGGSNGDGSGVSVEVSVDVNLPDVTVPSAGMVVDPVLSIAEQTVTLAESDVAALMAIVQGAGQDATSLINGTAQAGVSLTGTSASGSFNVSSGAGGATTLGTNLLGRTLNLVNANVDGAGYILGSMSAML